MRARYAVWLVVALGFATLVYWRSRFADEVEDKGRLADEASAAMHDLRLANVDLERWFPATISQLVTRLTVINDTPAARDEITRDLLPRLDAYLATADRAVTVSDAYMKVDPMPDAIAKLDVIRKRNAKLHELRGSFVRIAGELSGDGGAADVEKIASELQAAGMKLLLVN